MPVSLTRQPVLGSLADPFGTAAVNVKKYPAPAAGQHCGDCQRFQGKTTSASGGCMADRSSARRSRLDELQDKFIFGLRRIGRVPIARIGWIAQEVGFRQEPESDRFDFAAKKRLVDSMQGSRFGNPGARPAGMIGDDVEAPRLERAEDGPVHLSSVDAQEAQVVIVEHQRDKINLCHSERRRHRIVETSRHRDDGGGCDACISQILLAFSECDD